MQTTTPTDYQTSMEVKLTPQEAADLISRVSDWWTKNTRGNTKNLNDIFTVSFGETFSRFRIIELIPAKRIVWYVEDCNLHWMKDKKEWMDTKIVFEISASNDSAKIGMTHIGLNAGKECFEDCTGGWNHYIKESLYKLMTEDQGVPDHKDYSALEKQ